MAVPCVSTALERARLGAVAGSRESAAVRLENGFYAGLTILTYDDLIERAEQYLRFLQRYRNGHEK